MKLLNIFTTITIVFFLGVLGCSPETSTPPVSTPTATECPPPTPVVIYTQPRSSFLVFVLIENTHPYHESGNFQKTQEDLKAFFENNTSSGDKVVMALLSEELVEEGLNASIFFDDTAKVIDEQIPPTPVSTPTELPQPTPIPTRRTQLGATAVALTQAAENHNFQVTQTAISNSYNCDYTQVQTNYVVAASTSDANQISRNIEFAEKISASFSGITAEPEKETETLEGLRMASDFMKDNCTSEFNHCVLLVFSNLHDFREEWQSASMDVKVDLQGIDVIPVFYDCRYIDGKCEKKVSKWFEHFGYFNARSVTFLLNNKNIVEQLQLSFIQLTDGSK